MYPINSPKYSRYPSETGLQQRANALLNMLLIMTSSPIAENRALETIPESNTEKFWLNLYSVETSKNTSKRSQPPKLPSKFWQS
mmetsp:Transcript_19862/g.24078  ORF Transcript_19862/g.24078 Transcript_19862/m.24078 type:complete len:84 (-) Transcript_19862:1699-1950(-)